MPRVLERLRAWWQAQKLARGRCLACDRVLRDDEESGYCSLACWAEDGI